MMHPFFFLVRPAWALARRCGVSAALIPSSTPRRVLDSVLAHAGEEATAAPLVLVGKGLTFDSGGL